MLDYKNLDKSINRLQLHNFTIKIENYNFLIIPILS